MTGFVRVVAAILFMVGVFLPLLAFVGAPIPAGVSAPALALALFGAPVLWLLAQMADGIERIAGK